MKTSELCPKEFATTVRPRRRQVGVERVHLPLPLGHPAGHHGRRVAGHGDRVHVAHPRLGPREGLAPVPVKGCLVARRLLERGVPFVEVSLGAGGLGWDTHTNNFQTVRSLSEQLDSGWAALMGELKDRDLMQDTTIIWMGWWKIIRIVSDC